MNSFRHKLHSALGVFALTAGLMVVGGTTASAVTPPDFTCTSGGVPVGTYHTLTIAGACKINQGDVTVNRNLVINPGASLIAAYGGSNLNVGNDVLIGNGSVLIMGCEPTEFQCLNDPDNVSTTFDSIGSNLVATSSLAVVVHAVTIHGEVADTAGGDGGSCASQAALMGFPAFTDYTDNVIWGDMTVADHHTCWDGMHHNFVGGSVNWNNNHTTIGDGNLMGANDVEGSLSCFNNNPLPHLNDVASPTPNAVGGLARGQCAAISVTGAS